MSNTMNDLPIPIGMYCVINPCQDSHWHTCCNDGAKQMYPNNFEDGQNGVLHFYMLLKPQDFGTMIGMVLFWFHAGSTYYSAIGFGPFGLTPNSNEEMKHFHEFCDKIQLPDTWPHLIIFNKISDDWCTNTIAKIPVN